MTGFIIAVGSEMLTPFRVDTNSLFVTEHLNAIGVDVRMKAVVGDDVGELTRLLRGGLEWANVIVLTGGLGPTEDDRQFHYGAASVGKDRIAAVRVLINGSPIAAYVSTRSTAGNIPQATSFEDRPEGIARDRWDVAIEGSDGLMLVECGAIRERVSQELARAVFDAVKRDLERQDAA